MFYHLRLTINLKSGHQDHDFIYASADSAEELIERECEKYQERMLLASVGDPEWKDSEFSHWSSFTISE